MIKEFNQSPLPFQGQKKQFFKEFKCHLKAFQTKTIFVDLFGGSGLLSHIVKTQRPDAKVIWNDYDYFIDRLNNINKTNSLLARLREECKRYIGGDEKIEKKERMPDDLKNNLLNIIQSYEKEHGYVDYITISTSLLFSGKYANNYQELSSNSFYYKIKKNDYDANGYIENVEVVHLNYKELFDLYKQNKDVCFIIDPPYLSTDCSSYNNGYWRLTDYLDVLKCLQGVSYFYFTSDKSSIVELLGWLAMQPNFENPLKEATLLKHKNHVNYHSQYEDMMLYSCK